MKKLLSLLLAVLMMMSAALAEGMTPVNTPITIDGVRVAFFDTEGNYLQPMEQEGLLWVPLNALCENLGKTAQVQGQSVMVDGVRIGMFDEAGNFLMPQEVNGTIYVPAVAFCQSAGVSVEKTEKGVAITRAAEAPAPAAEPEHPEYVPVDLTASNFSQYFSYSISVEKFKNWDETYRGGGNYIVFQHWSCDYVLRATALTPYRFENVRFTVTNPGIKANAQYDVKGVTFSNLTMPQSGEMTRTESYEGTYLSMYAIINSADKVLYDANDLHSSFFEKGHTSVTNVSGRVYIPWEDAQAMLESKYNQAQKDMESGNYQAAVNRYKELAENQYKDAAKLLSEAEEKLAAQKAQKQKDDYAAAQAAFDNGDWDAAIKGFKALGDYEDSKAKVTAATENKNSEAYEAALALKDSGKYDEAIKAFEALGNYKDSAQHLAACHTAKADQENRAAYEAAEQLEAAGDYVGAYDAFIKIANFGDSAQRAEKLLVSKTFQQAEALVAERKFDDAIELLTPYQENPQIQEMINICNLRGAALLSPFTAEGWAFFVKNGYHFIDLHGNVKPLPAGEIVKYNNEFVQDGMILMKTNGSYYFVNLNGETVGETYKEARHFKQGRAVVTTKDGKTCLIDKQGQVVSTLPAKKGRTYGYYQGSDLVSFSEKKQTGLANLKGKVIVKAGKYKGIMSFTDGVAEVYASKAKTGKLIYGVINEKGKEVLKLGKFDVEAVLGKDLIVVKENKRYGIVNEKGKSLLPAEYKNVIRVGDLILADKNGKRGAYDLALNPVIPHEYETISVGYQSQVVALKKDGVYKLYNLKDLTRPLIEGTGMSVKQDRESPYIAWYEQDRGYFVYDHEGNLIF